MIYRFRSKASGDLIMLGPLGDRLLRAWGREPSAKGIVEVADMPQALAQLDAAIAAEAAELATARALALSEGKTPPTDTLSLRQRWWPMREMLERCHGAAEVIVWGV